VLPVEHHAGPREDALHGIKGELAEVHGAAGTPAAPDGKEPAEQNAGSKKGLFRTDHNVFSFASSLLRRFLKQGPAWDCFLLAGGPQSDQIDSALGSVLESVLDAGGNLEKPRAVPLD